jgi:hypothetical protein
MIIRLPELNIDQMSRFSRIFTLDKPGLDPGYLTCEDKRSGFLKLQKMIEVIPFCGPLDIASKEKPA